MKNIFDIVGIFYNKWFWKECKSFGIIFVVENFFVEVFIFLFDFVIWLIFCEIRISLNVFIIYVLYMSDLLFSVFKMLIVLLMCIYCK